MLPQGPRRRSRSRSPRCKVRLGHPAPALARTLKRRGLGHRTVQHRLGVGGCHTRISVARFPYKLHMYHASDILKISANRFVPAGERSNVQHAIGSGGRCFGVVSRCRAALSGRPKISSTHTHTCGLGGQKVTLRVSRLARRSADSGTAHRRCTPRHSHLPRRLALTDTPLRPPRRLRLPRPLHLPWRTPR